MENSARRNHGNFCYRFGLGFGYSRFPCLVPLIIPPIIRAFMLRPFQRDLYSLAQLLGVYADLLFLVGAASGALLARWRR